MKQPATPRHRRSGGDEQSALVMRVLHRAREIITECAQAQRRLAELTSAPDRYLSNPNQAPDTYEEFLFRTSGLMRHEPAARARTTR